MADSNDSQGIAYFTVFNDRWTGWTGGLLLLNSAGRPLEFQCTLPVRPSRAHEILFGPTLRDHLISEVIGPLLVKNCRTPMALLCCDQPEALALSGLTDVPVALVSEAAESEEGPIEEETITHYGSVQFAGATLRVPIERVDELAELQDQFANLPDGVEPFERIREAIKEAHSQIARSNAQRAA